MSTQRRVVRWQRLSSSEVAGYESPSSLDEGISGLRRGFRRAEIGLTASRSRPQFGMRELATNSLGFGSGCGWQFCHRARGSNERRDAASLVSGSSVSSSCRRRTDVRSGILSKQLPSISTLLAGVSEQENASARSMQSALPRVPVGDCPGTERQYGQGNLYLKHAARDAAGNFGRRSARRDLLRAGK